MTPEELVADGLMSIQEAAKFLGVSRPMLYTLRDLPWVRIGRRRLLPRKAVIELAANSIEERKEASPFFPSASKRRKHQL